MLVRIDSNGFQYRLHSKFLLGIFFRSLRFSFTLRRTSAYFCPSHVEPFTIQQHIFISIYVAVMLSDAHVGLIGVIHYIPLVNVTANYSRTTLCANRVHTLLRAAKIADEKNRTTSTQKILSSLPVPPPPLKNKPGSPETVFLR